MSRFRHTRLALSRFFTLLSGLACPDGEPTIYIKLLVVNDLLKDRMDDHHRAALDASKEER